MARFVRDWEEKRGKSIKQMWITIENSSGDRTDDHTIVQKEIKEVPILVCTFEPELSRLYCEFAGNYIIGYVFITGGNARSKVTRGVFPSSVAAETILVSGQLNF